MQKIYRRTPMPKCHLKLQGNFIKIALRHGCSRVNFLHIFRNTSGWLLLEALRIMNFKKTQVLRRFKPCSRSVGDSRWWGSLTMVPAGNKATPFVGQPYHKNNSSSSSSPIFSSNIIIKCGNEITLENIIFVGKSFNRQVIGLHFEET